MSKETIPEYVFSNLENEMLISMALHKCIKGWKVGLYLLFQNETRAQTMGYVVRIYRQAGLPGVEEDTITNEFYTGLRAAYDRFDKISNGRVTR